MAKGVTIKFKSYEETIQKLLAIIKLEKELAKQKKIVLKPCLKNNHSPTTNSVFVEQVLKYCLQYKNPEADIFIAEGSDGEDTMDMFEKKGYKSLAERYPIGLIDLNDTEVEEVLDGEFIKFEKIIYPKILMESYVISLPPFSEDEETDIIGALSNMIGAFPAQYYKGFFSKTKSKIRKHPMKYSIHDIIRCKVPDFAIIDASDKGLIIAGRPLEVDKQLAKLFGKDWRQVSYLRLIDESFLNKKSQKKEVLVNKEE